MAGLEVLRIINEPTAAALAYGLGRTTKERIAVYDFGGGTFDCTLLDLSGNVFEVLATSGDSFLGGDDLDLSIAERMAATFLRTHRYDPRTDPQAFERLRVMAETVKIELSTLERTSIKLRELGFGVGGTHLELGFGMTREELERLAMPLVERSFAVCQEALSVAQLPVTAFDKVILVGGSTRIPLVRTRVEQFFGTQPLDRVNADEVVAIGAAIQAAALTEVARRRSSIPAAPIARQRRSSIPPPIRRESDDEVTMATRLPSRIAEMERLVAPPGSSPPPARPSGRPPPLVPPAPPTIPTATARMVSMTSTMPLPPAPPSSSSSTTEDVAATIPRPVLYADIVRSTIPPEGAPAEPPLPLPPVLVDVTPRALVVETVGGWCDVVVQRNAKIPCERTRAFTTSSDNQTIVQVRVAQGEDALFRNNTFLGAVELVGLRAAPRGDVTIRTRFEVDESGTLKVFATDLGTGREAHALLQLVGIAGAETIEAMQARNAAARVS